ncbi:MAG TPA: recombinase family protein [Candidatus Saccharibacteria bacterium]|nr:recombinase family protein [Candidatus Saccharibacteria bacterium]
MRKSTEEAERQVLSLSSQEDQIRVRFSDLNIVEWYTESKSAFEPDKRPKFKEMLERIDEGKIEGIIAWHPDRLSRNEVDASAVTYRIRQMKIKDLKFASGFNFDQTPESMMMLQMTMSQSQYYSAKLSKDVKRGNEKKRQMGGLTGQAPEGYINVRTSLTGRGEARVEKDPERFYLMRRAFELFLTGEYSVQSIHTIMTDEWGYKTAIHGSRGGKPIVKNTLYNSFRNVRYAGLVPDPYDSEKFYKADFPAMITAEEYDKVQTLLGRKGMPRLTTRKQFALRGLIRCGLCGCMITAERKTKKLATGKIASYDYYHCTGKRGCAQRSFYIRETELWDELNELLNSYELVPELYEWAMDAFREFAEQEVTGRNSIQVMQDKSIESTQTQLDRLLDMATRGLIDDEQYRTKGAELKSQLNQLQEERAGTNYRVKNWYEMATETFEKLTSVSEKFKDGDIASKKDILLAIGQNPTLTNGKLAITPNEWLVPVAKSAKGLRDEIDRVRTEPLQIQKASEEAVSNQWWGWMESNHLPSGYASHYYFRNAFRLCELDYPFIL